MTKDIGTSALLDAWAHSGSISEPSPTKKDLGWVSGERPPAEYLNWNFNVLAQAVNGILRRGVPDWDAGTLYVAGDLAKRNGVVYAAAFGNINSQPPSVNWARTLGAEPAGNIAVDLVMRGAKLARDVVASVASASSIDLSGVHGDVFNVTGNVGIAAFANGVKGQLFIVRFSGAPLLTHDATVLRCPSNASIQVAAGDRMDLLVYDDSGHCEIVNYTRANGQPLLLPTIVPAGTFFPFAGGTLPGNYLWCDGASYLRSTYPLLFTAISTNWGAADGTHFNVPDLRGIFLRGFNNGVTSDPDASTRIGKVGGATGDNIGSYQNDKVVDHTHLLDKEDVNVPSTSTGSHQTVADARGAGTGGAYEPLATGGIAGGGGAETRPKNAQAPYIIRYQ